MLQLTNEQLRQLQLVQLELLLEFDRICRKHHIMYSLTGGTLLGAVRNGGFIPWDDDSDVSMMRSEYEKFVAVCEQELDTEKFYFQDIDRTPGYRWGYAKLRRKDTIFLRENQEHMPYEQGIFMDIFPRDSVPDGVVSGEIHKFLCFCVRKTLWSAVGRYAAPTKKGRVWYGFLYFISKPWINGAYHSLVKISQNESTGRVRALTFPIPHGEKGYLREWYNSYEEIEFEGHLFLVESGYKDWLAQEFHNYMSLPPVESRKIHPVVDIKFVDNE